jgi:hypothetical protein
MKTASALAELVIGAAIVLVHLALRADSDRLAHAR